MGMGFEIISKYSDEMMNIIFFAKRKWRDRFNSWHYMLALACTSGNLNAE